MAAPVVSHINYSSIKLFSLKKKEAVHSTKISKHPSKKLAVWLVKSKKCVVHIIPYVWVHVTGLGKAILVLVSFVHMIKLHRYYMAFPHYRRKEHETSVLFLAMLESWTNTVIEFLWTDEKGEGNRQKKHRSNVSAISSNGNEANYQLILHLCRGMEVEDLVFSPDYSNSIAQDNEDEEAIEWAFRKK